MATSAITIPQSVRTEHTAIHAALEEAQNAPGRIGAAARRLAQVLHPHFVREEQIALPPLALLAPLASGSLPAGARDILPLTDALERELPRMLDEHVRIRAALDELRRAAEAEGSQAYGGLADQCHSNETKWPAYSRVAPVSWLIQHDVSEGRAILNFSEWQRPQEEATEAAEEIFEGEMPPGMYQLMHAHARLSAADRDRLARGLVLTLGGPLGDERHGER